MLDFSRCRLEPFQHQKEDVEWLINQPTAFIASEMRTGKTKIVIDAAQFLYDRGLIDKVIVIAPAPVRDVWADPQLGEIAKHAWLDVPNKVTEYHSKLRIWSNGVSPDYLHWYVTNFEFIRAKSRLNQLMPACGPKTLLVLDESSFVKNHSTIQTKNCMQLRKACGRVVLLNGTPLFHSPLDLFSQGNLVNKKILDCQYVSEFKARYAVMQPIRGAGGKVLLSPRGNAPLMSITGWTPEGLKDLQQRFAPYTVRRLQAECLDLPPKLDPVILTAALTPETWHAYKQMRDEFVVWLTNDHVASSRTAAVKALRLSQLTGGFLGGVEEAFPTAPPVENELLESLDLGYMKYARDETTGTVSIDIETTPVEKPEAPDAMVAISREKLDVLLWFIEQRLETDQNLHLVTWSRFRAEVARNLEAVRERFPQFITAPVWGGQKRDERRAALALLKPETSPEGPVFVAGIEGTGSFGLDMTASHTCVTMSSGYSPGRAAQTLDRTYGPGQRFPVAYFSILATGPKGERTIDHVIEAARRGGQDVATWTSAAWVKALRDE